jgi:hypothetical protein
MPFRMLASIASRVPLTAAAGASGMNRMIRIFMTRPGAG